VIPWVVGGFLVLKVVEALVEKSTEEEDRAHRQKVLASMEQQRRLLEQSRDTRQVQAQHELQRLEGLSADPRWKAEVAAARQRLRRGTEAGG
jgi:hypothetical protein